MREYKYKTRQAHKCFESIVTCYEPGKLPIVVSYEKHPTRSRAYKYAAHMAKCFRRNNAWLER